MNTQDAKAELTMLVKHWDDIIAEDGIEAAKHDIRSRVVLLLSRGFSTPSVYPDGTGIDLTRPALMRMKDTEKRKQVMADAVKLMMAGEKPVEAVHRFIRSASLTLDSALAQGDLEDVVDDLGKAKQIVEYMINPL